MSFEESFFDSFISDLLGLSQPSSRREDWGKKIGGARKDAFCSSESRDVIALSGVLRSLEDNQIVDQSIRALMRKISLPQLLHGTFPVGNVYQALQFLAMRHAVNFTKYAKGKGDCTVQEVRTSLIEYLGNVDAIATWGELDSLASVIESFIAINDSSRGLMAKFFHPGDTELEHSSVLQWLANAIQRIDQVSGNDFAGSHLQSELVSTAMEAAGDRWKKGCVNAYPAVISIPTGLADDTESERTAFFETLSLGSLSQIAAANRNAYFVVDLLDTFLRHLPFSVKSANLLRDSLAPQKAAGNSVKETPVIPVVKAKTPEPGDSRLREGPREHINRSGNISESDIGERFGFSGLEYGNWVNQQERQDFLNESYDACADLAFALQIPDRMVSFDGFLSLAIGARGSGKASAHYEPGKKVINLTKSRGSGALAHEWSHAFDHYYCVANQQGNGFSSVIDNHFLNRTMVQLLNGENKYRTPVFFTKRLAERKLLPLVTIHSTEEAKVALQVIDFIGEIFGTGLLLDFFTSKKGGKLASNRDVLCAGIKEKTGCSDDVAMNLAAAWIDPLRKLYNRGNPYKFRSDFYCSSLVLDKFSEGKYWSSMIELWARMCSAMIHDQLQEQDIRNDFLSGFSSPKVFTSDVFSASPNPEGEERKRNFEHFQSFVFPDMRKLLGAR